MPNKIGIFVVIGILALVASAQASEYLRLNPHLDYSSDSEDGPLITGSRMEDGAVAGKANYVIIYGEGCFNSKRQARRTVDLYEKYNSSGEVDEEALSSILDRALE